MKRFLPSVFADRPAGPAGLNAGHAGVARRATRRLPIGKNILIALLVIAFAAATPAQEMRRRGTGDMVGEQAHQIRENVNDLLDKLVAAAPPQSLGDPETEALLAVGKLEGQLAALTALARNGRTQPYSAIMEDINRSLDDTDKRLRGWRCAGLAMNDWLRIQMDLRQLEVLVRSTSSGR